MIQLERRLMSACDIQQDYPFDVSAVASPSSSILTSLAALYGPTDMFHGDYLWTQTSIGIKEIQRDIVMADVDEDKESVAGSTIGALQLSSQQWEELKPIIKKLYIDENLLFKTVTKILQDKHGITITRRQFYKKIKEWGFAKNIKAEEMKALVGKVGDEAAVIRGRQVSQAKIKRFRRTHKRNLVFPSTSTHSTKTDQPVPPYTSQASSSSMSNWNHGSSVTAEVEISLASLPAPSDDFLPLKSSPNWSAVDVTGSPGLSRFMAALELESSRDIPPFSLDGSDSDEPQCITAEEVRYICPVQAGQVNEYICDMSTPSTGFAMASMEQYPTIRADTSDGIFGAGGIYPGKDDPFEGNLNPKMIESGCEVTFLKNHPSTSQHDVRQFSTWPSLKTMRNNTFIMEPSPFSILSSQSQGEGLGQWDICSAQELKKQKLEHKARLRMMANMLRVSHPMILQVKTSLGEIYQAQGKYEQADPLFRQVASLAHKAYGSDDIKTLDASLRVVGNIVEGGRNYRKAETLHRKLHTKIHQLFEADHPLAMKSSEIMADILFFLEEDAEACKISRQLLQIELLRSGPRAYLSILAMRNLANIFGFLERTAESENLLSIALQILREGASVSDRQISGVMRDLARALYRQYRYEECLVVYREAAVLAEHMLGLESDMYLRLNFWIAATLKELNRPKEGESLCQETLASQRKLLGDTDPSTLDTQNLLAEFFAERGSYEDAARLREKVFQGRTEVYGIEHGMVRRSCEHLGDCYEALGRSEDALVLFQDVLKQVSSTHGESHPTVLRMRERIQQLGQVHSHDSHKAEGT